MGRWIWKHVGILLAVAFIVVVIGLSCAAEVHCIGGDCYEDVVVSDAGSEVVNGTYIAAMMVLGKPFYTKDSTTYIMWNGNSWQVIGSGAKYSVLSSADTPPHTGYQVDGSGDLPAPTLSGGEAATPPGITVTPTSGLTTTESGHTTTFTVSANSEPSADVTIPLSSSDVGEGTVPAEVVLPAGSTAPVLVTVTGANDDVDDGDIGYTIVTGDPTSPGDTGYEALGAGSVADVSITNQDDDVAGITVAAISGPTTEAGGIATFSISANSAPVADVTIPLSSSDTGEGTVPSSVALPAGSTAPVLVTVTGVDDSIVDGDVEFTIATGDPTSQGDATYETLGAEDVSDVSVINQDDDNVPSLVIIPAGGGGPEAFLDVVLPAVDGEAPLMAGTLPLSAIHVAGAAIEGGCQILGDMGLPTCASYIHVYLYSVDISTTPETVVLVTHSIAAFDWDTLEHRFSIDTSGLAPGYYDLRLVFEDGSAVTLRVQITAPTD